MIFSVWDFTSAGSPIPERSISWRTGEFAWGMAFRIQRHTYSYYLTLQCFEPDDTLLVCHGMFVCPVEAEAKKRDTGVIFQPPPACTSVTMVCTCHNCFKTKLLLSRVTCSRQPQSLVPSPDRSEAQSAWICMEYHGRSPISCLMGCHQTRISL